MQPDLFCAFQLHGTFLPAALRWYFLSKLSVVSGKLCFSLVGRKSIGCILLWQLGHLTWVLLYLMATFRECLFQLFIFQVSCQFKLQKIKGNPHSTNVHPQYGKHFIKHELKKIFQSNKNTDIYWAPITVWEWCKNEETLTVHSWILYLENLIIHI